MQGRHEHIPSTSRPQHELEPCFNYFLLGIRLLCHSPSPATSPLLVFVLSFFLSWVCSMGLGREHTASSQWGPNGAEQPQPLQHCMPTPLLAAEHQNVVSHCCRDTMGTGGVSITSNGDIPKKSQSCPTRAIEQFLHCLSSELPKNGFTQCFCLPKPHFRGK